MKMAKKTALILAGGGGHTSIALAIAQILFGKVDMSFLVPEKDWLSRKILTQFGKVEHIAKLRDPLTPNYQMIVKFPMALIKSFQEVKNYDFVVSCGSNFCIPPAMVAWLRRIPVINIESRVAIRTPSKTARILHPISSLTVLQWEEQKMNLKGIVTGPIFPRREFEPWNGGYILVTGGTEGHKQLFDALSDSDLHNIVLQTGKIDPGIYSNKHPEWKVFSISEKFQETLAGADIVITHQGGGTIFESILYEKPLIIVHNPDLIRTAGVEDIRILALKVNAMFLIKITTNHILHAINEIKKYTSPRLSNGSEKLCDIILKILNNA